MHGSARDIFGEGNLSVFWAACLGRCGERTDMHPPPGSCGPAPPHNATRIRSSTSVVRRGDTLEADSAPDKMCELVGTTGNEVKTQGGRELGQLPTPQGASVGVVAPKGRRTLTPCESKKCRWQPVRCTTRSESSVVTDNMDANKSHFNFAREETLARTDPEQRLDGAGANIYIAADREPLPEVSRQTTTIRVGDWVGRRPYAG